MKRLIQASLFILVFTSCQTTGVLTRDYVQNGPKCLEYYREPSMADPGGLHIWLNQKGEMLIIINSHGGRDEYSMRLVKPEKQDLWNKIEAISTSVWNDKYEIGLDSKVYQLKLRADGDETQYMRYSAGAPQNIRTIVTFLEEKAKELIE